MEKLYSILKYSVYPILVFLCGLLLSFIFNDNNYIYHAVTPAAMISLVIMFIFVLGYKRGRLDDSFVVQTMYLGVGVVIYTVLAFTVYDGHTEVKKVTAVETYLHKSACGGSRYDMKLTLDGGKVVTFKKVDRDLTDIQFAEPEDFTVNVRYDYEGLITSSSTYSLKVGG